MRQKWKARFEDEVKAKLSLCLINYVPSHKDECRNGGMIPSLDGIHSQVSRPDRFNAGEIAPSTHWIGGWAGTRVSLDAVEYIKIVYLCWDRTPTVQPAVHRYRDWAILAPLKAVRSLTNRNMRHDIFKQWFKWLARLFQLERFWVQISGKVAGFVFPVCPGKYLDIISN
jgi:hypothetical protein